MKSPARNSTRRYFWLAVLVAVLIVGTGAIIGISRTGLVGKSIQITNVTTVDKTTVHDYRQAFILLKGRHRADRPCRLSIEIDGQFAGVIEIFILDGMPSWPKVVLYSGTISSSKVLRFLGEDPKNQELVSRFESGICVTKGQRFWIFDGTRKKLFEFRLPSNDQLVTGRLVYGEEGEFQR